MSLFQEIVKRVPVDIETALDSFGRVPNMANERDRLEFFTHWAKLNTDFAGTLVDVSIKRSREYAARLAAAGVDPNLGRAA